MDTSSSEFNDHLRQVIDDEINLLQESLRALKSRRNTLAPISRLPPETLTAVFSFLLPSAWAIKAGNLATICVTHVCRQWRDTALNCPGLWSDINFTNLTPAAMAKILARAQTMPLNMEADTTKWIVAESDALERQLEAHISHICHLSVKGWLRTALNRLVSSAPTLESLSLSHESGKFPIVIPVNLFNCTAPKLTSLELESCEISWKSPLLRGLRNLKILKPYKGPGAKPKLEDWLDALNEMPQLETLILDDATPLAPKTAPLIPRPSRAATLPSLTGFHLSASARDCAFALAHLELPALSWLHVNAKSHGWEGGDVRLLIPYVTQNVDGLGMMEPLRSILISGKGTHAKVVGWTMPDTDIRVSLPTWETFIRESGPPRLVFTATLRNSDYGAVTGILDAFLTPLPMNFVSTLITRDCTQVSKEFWLGHAPRWPLLEHVLLDTTTISAFRDMLAEDAPPDGPSPRLPLLTKLTLIDDKLIGFWTPHLRDMLIERVEQGVPLEVLDLSTCVTADRLIQLLREIVVYVHDKAARRMILEKSAFINWHGGIGYCYQAEGDDGWVPCPCDDDEDEDEEDEEDSDDDDEFVE